MRKKDILELKKRLKKDDCTFTKMCGCYVDADKRKVLNISETFLNLRDEEFFKYLEIAKKVLSGTIGNNILKLEFPPSHNGINEKQNFLLEFKKSKLKDEDLLNSFYDSIINSYEYTGNYLILVFHDAYDIIAKTSDNLKLDESEEVYEYILCAICPVSLSKPGLRYFQDDNRIGVRIRDWVVDLPNVGFIYPAFCERSTDVNSIMYYSKNPKDPHPELMDLGLGCDSKQTATEQKELFNNIIINAVGDDKAEEVIMDIHESINNIIDQHNEIGDTPDSIVLTSKTVQEVMLENGISEDISLKIEQEYINEFGETPPIAEHIIDSKILNANEKRKKEQKLEKQVEFLKEKLEETEAELKIRDNLNINDNYDIMLSVKPEKLTQIKSEIIDGKKCIIIPMEENDNINLNGNNIENIF